MNRPMKHRTAVLVPLDGSHFSEAILGTVARLAAPLRAHVELLLVGDPTLDPEQPLPAARGLVGVRIDRGATPGGAL